MKKFSVTLFLLFVMICPSAVFGATLAEIDWDTGTGQSTTAIRGGYFDRSGTGCWTVHATDGTVPGGRNYLSFKEIPEPNNCDPMVDTNGWGLSVPYTIYYRVWVRYHANLAGVLTHTHSICSDTAHCPTSSNADPFPLRTESGKHSLAIGGATKEYVGPSYVANQWHRMELKIVNNIGATDSIFVRIDGVDVTNQFTRFGGNLSTDNGSLSLAVSQYLNFHMGNDTYPSSEFVDYAGLKVTNGPDWIGGDDGANVIPAPPNNLREVK